MSKAPPPQLPAIAEAGETGTLGIVYLKRFWSQKITAQTQTLPGAITAGDLVAENVLLAGLRLGVRETLDFLMQTAPSFEEFEAWVRTKSGGTIAPARVERLNGALRGTGGFALESIQAEPALSADDLAFWDEHGYVVVKQAVSPEHCRAAVQAIFEHAGMDLNRPDSWYGDAIWILLAHHPALWANRNSGRIHTAFAQIWQRNDLWMNVDVCGVNPPERPGYKFRGSALHWDMTLTPPLRLGTQAILYLTDTAANQGAFSCVPGFHRKLETWLREQPAGTDPRVQALKELQAIPIAGAAGDLIIWHHALPHGATPNRAALPRVVQYLNMFPSQYDINAEWS
ncbi:MAG TPA: phytanoyl-CoA dioxygenase family protein [Opitutaceae bacterium]|jgi:ectoine hydroxylase-related dioxygenase (phytanoyl-CoA dioxygenase family)|nr:phytanoyl-CoA dioxygenase family protein [Opitutaceae bacterium]